MEGDGSRLYELMHQSLQGGEVYCQVTAMNQRRQTVDEGVHPKQGLITQGCGLFRSIILTRLLSNMAQQPGYPQQDRLCLENTI